MTQIGDRVEHAIDQRADVEHEIERGAAAEPAASHRLRRSVFWLAVTGVSLYLVAPSLIDTFGSSDDLDELAPGWLAAMAALQALALACLWALQYLAMRGPSWPAVVSSQLAGNALAKVAPGGGALGAALQYRMLVKSGLPANRAVAGLTAASLLVFAVVLAMPVLAVPAILRGGVSRSLIEPTLIGLVVLRRAVRDRDRPDRLRPAARVGRPHRPAHPQPDPPPRRALAQAAGAAAARAHAHRRDARAALEARAGGDLRPLGVRLRDAAGRAGRRRLGASPRARAARLLHRPGAGADPDHAGRPRVRRGRADRHARADRGARRGRRCSPPSPTGCSPTGSSSRSASPPSAGTRGATRERRRRASARPGPGPRARPA